MKHFTWFLTSLKPGGCDSFSFGWPPNSVTLLWLTLSSLLLRMDDSSLVERNDTLLMGSIFAIDGCLLNSCTHSVNARLSAITLDNSSRNHSMLLAGDSIWPAASLSHMTIHFSHVTILCHYLQTFLQLIPFCDTVSVQIVFTY